MKTSEQALFLVMSVCLCTLGRSSAQTCDGLFRCNDTRSFQLCSSSSSEVYTCEAGTFCSSDCAYPCVATPDCAPRCNAAGFYCTSTTESQLCVDDDPPSGDVVKCPDTYVCSMNCDVQCSPDDCRRPAGNNVTLPCDDVGIFPDVNNVTNFYLCSRLSTGLLHATLYTCPEEFTFDTEEVCAYTALIDETIPESLSCGTSQFQCLTSTEFSVCVDGGPPEGHWTCPQDTFCHEDNEQPCSESVPTTTTTITPFVCERDGKFPDPANCNSYYLCARRVSGGFHQVLFSCPVASFFNVVTGQCSRDPKVCSLTTTPQPTSTSTTSAAPFVCTQAGRFPDRDSCKHYYQCTRRWFSAGFNQSRRKCILWSFFDSVSRKCVFRSAAVCVAP